MFEQELVETCPVFVIEKGEIHDIWYSDWQRMTDGWHIVGVQDFVASQDTNAGDVIIELPIGCFTLGQISIRTGETCTVAAAGNGYDLRRCVRPTSRSLEHSEIFEPMF
jgi:hypothetical protein